jgi:hypothetical protein
MERADGRRKNAVKQPSRAEMWKAIETLTAEVSRLTERLDERGGR